MKYKILFIGGSLNQTTMMHQISQHFGDCDCFFTPYYADGIIDWGVRKGLLNFTILAGTFRTQTENYLRHHNLTIDYKGVAHHYDLVFTCQDLIIPRNIRNKKLVLVQEGMTEPENLTYHMVRTLRLPRWLAGTSTTGMSNAYDLFFVASQGYKELFISKGADPDRIHVTGIPNFDHATKYFFNDFPYRNFVLAATSDRRETLNYENRKQFIDKVLNIAAGRQVIFKLHPNENRDRATREIHKYAPDALVFTEVNINHLIANCDVLVTRHSSVVYIGMALGKEVYSDFSMEFLQRLTPIQNEGRSAGEIARITRHYLLPEVKLNALEIGSGYQQVPQYALI
jgi:UDP-N-acetylglucosamine 2-epimerase